MILLVKSSTSSPFKGRRIKILASILASAFFYLIYRYELIFSDGKDMQSNNTLHEDKADISSNATFEINANSCDPLPLLSSFNNPGDVNKLRRTIGLNNMSCYTQHLPIFANYTKQRLAKVKNQLILHIPKTGGTSLCSLAISLNKNVPENNCWENDHFHPLWCCYAFDKRRRWPIKKRRWFKNVVDECGIMDNQLPELAMNENYLDYPLCLNERIYSVVIREPVNRTISQETQLNHLKQIKKFDNDINATLFNARLNLARNNYMTWALAIGSSYGPMEDLHKLYTMPQPKLLEIAKQTLLQMDFIMDPVSQTDVCLQAKINLMMDMDDNTSATLGHANSWGKRPKLHHYHNISREQYAAWNDLDIELYRYATSLIELDCLFYFTLDNLE